MFSFIKSYFKLRAVRRNKAFPRDTLYLSIDEPYAIEILNALATNTHIKHIMVTTNKLPSKHVKNPIYPAQTKALTQALQTNQQLQTLKLVGCHFNRHDATLFQEGLAANRSLIHLELTQCHADPIAGYALSDAVASLSNLNRLIIRHCDFRNKTSLLGVITQLTNLTVLDLSENDWSNLPSEESDQLIQAIATSSHLRSVNLEKVNFADENFSSKLTQALQNKSLTKLYLKRNGFTTQAMLETNKLLETHPQLQEVSFGTSHVSFELNLATLDSALNTIKTHKAIKKAIISYFNLDYLVTKFADVVHENNTLQDITLESSSLFFKKDNFINLKPLATALETNLTIRSITCIYAHKALQKFSHSIVEKTQDKKVAQKLQQLLSRNQLLFTIKQNPKRLPELLEAASPALFDELFFLNLLRTLPATDLIQHDAVLIKFMLKPANRWERFKWQIGLSNGNTERLSTILEKLIDSAEKGNEADFKLLQQLHNTPAFLNILGVKQWAQIFKTIADKSPSFSQQAHFIVCHSALLNNKDRVNTNTHFQTLFADHDSNVLFLYAASKKTTKSTLGEADNIHNAANAITSLVHSQNEVTEAFKKFTTYDEARIEYFKRYQQFLDKYQAVHVNELTEAEYDIYSREADFLLSQSQLDRPLRQNLIEKLEDQDSKLNTAKQKLSFLK